MAPFPLPLPPASQSVFSVHPANIRHTVLFSFLYLLLSLFLSLSSCQNQLRSHPWKHSETLQLELIITFSALTVIVLPPHSTYYILSYIMAVSITISLHHIVGVLALIA